MAKNKEPLKVVKKLSNGSKLFNNHMVVTPVARLCFVNFVTPRQSENDDGNKRENYGCTPLFKRKEDLSLIKLACQRFAIQEKGEKGKRLKNPLRLQDDKVDDYDGFVKGAYFMNCTTKFAPKCIDGQKNEIERSAVYSGCYARLTLRPYYYENKGNKGIGLGIAAVQFIRDGEPLGGGGVDPDDVFDADESDDIEDDMEEEDIDDEDEEEDDEDDRPRRKKGKSRREEFV